MSYIENLEKQLFEMQDLKYRDFHSKLLPGIDRETIIGIRTPMLRKFTKEFAETLEAELFLKDLPHRYYEENNMHMMIISWIKDYEVCLKEVKKLLPYVNNWATCDLPAPKCFAKHKDCLLYTSFFFACMNVSVRLAGDLPSVQKSFFRNLVAAVFAAIILGKNHIIPKVQKQYWGSLFLRCAFGTLGILCNFYAIDHLLVADASILNKLSPFFAIIFSFLLLKEKITPTQGSCVLLAFIGCLFVVKPGLSLIHIYGGKEVCAS